MSGAVHSFFGGFTWIVGTLIVRPPALELGISSLMTAAVDPMFSDLERITHGIVNNEIEKK